MSRFRSGPPVQGAGQPRVLRLPEPVRFLPLFPTGSSYACLSRCAAFGSLGDVEHEIGHAVQIVEICRIAYRQDGEAGDMVEPSQGRTTMFDIISSSTLQHLLLTYGYVAVFFVVAIESMGMPVPGEMTLMAASVYAGTTHHLQIGLVVLAAGAGAILGDNVGYLLGRKGGLRLLQRYGPAVRLDDRSLGLA